MSATPRGLQAPMALAPDAAPGPGIRYDARQETNTFRSRGPSNSTSMIDCQVPSMSCPADTGMVREGPRIDDAMWDQAWDGSCA